MPIRINDSSVINHFKEFVPGAAGHGETYLQAVASRIRENRAPVTMSVDALVTDGFRTRKLQCLVAEPTDPRLRHYRTAHYAIPSGGNLTVGWSLVGGEKAAGFQVGAFSFGGPTELGVEEVLTIVETMHDYAVLPAMEEIAAVGSYDVNPTYEGMYMEFLADVLGALFSAYIVGVIGASVYFWAKKTNRTQAPIVRRFIGFAYGLAWPVLVVMHFAGKQQARAQEAERLAAESRILGEGKD